MQVPFSQNIVVYYFGTSIYCGISVLHLAYADVNSQKGCETMTENLRACVAGIVFALINCHSITSVYSFEKAEYFTLSGHAQRNEVRAYDHSRACYISGSSCDATAYSLYDNGTGSYISIKIAGTNFTGYDNASGASFSGSVSGRSVSIYDYATGRYYNYSC